MERYLPKEKENRKIGMGVSIGFHVLLLLIFLFIIRPSDANNSGIPGVEINFGTVAAGKGDVHEPNKVKTQNTEDAKPEKSSSPEPVEEEVVEQNTPQTQEAVVKGENVQSTPAESPHVVKEQSDLSSKTSKDQKVTEAAKPKTEKSETTKDGGSGKAGEKSEAVAASNGNQNVMGDQGDPKGKIEDRALFGKPGKGGGGPHLSMAGWNWESIPDKVDPSQEKGFVVFEFKVNDHGQVEWIKTKVKTVSPSVAKFYENQLWETTFRKEGGSTVTNFIGTARFEVKAE